ncbi:MAG: histidine phosphatase family protein, partial [Pseudonocardia sp.]|nr:histidine phosphatase family protein [Pseudonocardia sp.]
MRLVLLGHAATAATRAAAFPEDEPLDAGGRSGAARLLGAMPRADQVRCAPSTRCRQTAEAAGLHAVPDAGLSGCDFGDWTGRTLDEVAAENPDAVTEWLTDPSARPHGGESLTGLLDRVGHWLDGRDSTDDRPPGATLIAIADPTVIRAAVV